MQRKGKLVLTDFMPIIEGSEKTEAEGTEIHRLLECTKGNVNVKLEWYPKFNFGKDLMNITKSNQCWIASSGKDAMLLGGVAEGKIVDVHSSPMLTSYFKLSQGEKKVVIMKWNGKSVDCDITKSEKVLKETVDKWKILLRQNDFKHEEWVREFFPLLKRSALTLKLLTHIDTGAIAAAATTSLPEWIGGELNWDYRYSWIRDSALTTQALVMLGHNDDAIKFLEWAENNHERYFEREKRLHVMYGLHGEIDFKERQLDHLEGYKGSKPVRIGNRAFEQAQHGIFGDVFSIAYELLRREIELSGKVMSFLTKVADYACEIWNKPDHGIWELPELLHYVESKVMVWMALDRALVLAERYGLEGDVDKWYKST
jgi:GH15 family glucan-1,4-alpha-glucosidase